MKDTDRKAFEEWIINSSSISSEQVKMFQNMTERERIAFALEQGWQAALEYERGREDSSGEKWADAYFQKWQNERQKSAKLVKGLQFARMVLSDAGLMGAVEDLNEYLEEYNKEG